MPIREIGYTCRFAKFNTREKSVFKKICKSRKLIRLRYTLHSNYQLLNNY